MAKWELELRRARLLVESNEQINHVCKATDDLRTNASSVVSSESEGFFSNLTSIQQNSTGKT